MAKKQRFQRVHRLDVNAPYESVVLKGLDLVARRDKRDKEAIFYRS